MLGEKAAQSANGSKLTESFLAENGYK